MNTIDGQEPPASFLLNNMLRKAIIENKAVPDRLIVSPEVFADAFMSGDLDVIPDCSGNLTLHTFKGVIIEM